MQTMEIDLNVVVGYFEMKFIPGGGNLQGGNGGESSLFKEIS